MTLASASSLFLTGRRASAAEALSSAGIFFFSFLFAHGESLGRRLAAREGLLSWRRGRHHRRRLVGLHRHHGRRLHAPRFRLAAGRARSGGEALPLPLRLLPRRRRRLKASKAAAAARLRVRWAFLGLVGCWCLRCRSAQVTEGPSWAGGEEADCAAWGLDPDPGEAGDPADPAGPLLGWRGQCHPQLWLEILWPCKYSSRYWTQVRYISLG